MKEENDRIRTRTKELEDKKRGAKPSDIQVGDIVLVEDDTRIKGQARFRKLKYQVMGEHNGDLRLKCENGSVLMRNLIKVRKYMDEFPTPYLSTIPSQERETRQDEEEMLKNLGENPDEAEVSYLIWNEIKKMRVFKF